MTEAAERASEPRPRKRLFVRILLSVGILAALGGVGFWAAVLRDPSPTPRIPGSENAPPGMVRVAAGPFWQGCPESGTVNCFEWDRPGRTVTLAGFFIDRLEVTVADYKKCVAAGKCPNTEDVKQPDYGEFAPPRCNLPLGRDNHPMNCVHWGAADRYCKWLGKRLPTEAEWERAARGTDQRLYPWGNAKPTCKLAIFDSLGTGFGCNEAGVIGTSPVGSKPSGASPYGALDMIGNVAEWTNDVYVREYYQTGPAENPAGGPRDDLAELIARARPNRGFLVAEEHVNTKFVEMTTRGTSWHGHVGLAGHAGGFVFSRERRDPMFQFDTVGFRCARSIGANE
jgi:formylglycine-generating enzyme